MPPDPVPPAPITDDQLITRARESYAHPSDDNLEIDEEPAVARSSDGAWVNAWVWVSYDSCRNSQPS